LRELVGSLTVDIVAELAIAAGQEIHQYDSGKEAVKMKQPYFETLDSKNIVIEMA
jgi:hypothetical protein